MQVTFIYSTRNQLDKFYVHRADCSDLHRKTPGEQNRWTVDADTAKQAVKDEIIRLLEQDIQGDHEQNFKLCACVKNRRKAE